MSLVQYKIRCTTDNTWEVSSFIPSTDPIPTTCPVNGAHTINSTLTYIFDTSDVSSTTTTGGLTTSMIASSSQVSDITLTLPPTTGTSGYVMQTDGTGVLSFVDVNNLFSDSGYIMAGGDEINTTKSSFQTIFKLMFPGTSTFGNISAIKVVARSERGNSEIRILDRTNATIIAGPTTLVDDDGSGDEDDSILTLTSIQNVPTGEAIFEVQGRKTTGKKCYISYCIIIP